MVLTDFYEFVNCLVAWFDMNISHILGASALQEPSEV